MPPCRHPRWSLPADDNLVLEQPFLHPNLCATNQGTPQISHLQISYTLQPFQPSGPGTRH